MLLRSAAMKLSIETRLDYRFPHPTDVLLQLEAAIIPEQRVDHAHIALSDNRSFARVAGHDQIGDRIWLRVEDRLTVDYRATVEVCRDLAVLTDLPRVEPHLLPGETIEYLMPSRYCPSDFFESFVEAEFAGLYGGQRVEAIRAFVADNIAYVSGSSNGSTTALETFVQRKGVCRDFAHVVVTLTRACGIPARIASVYAPDVQPQDFHAVAEVFLGGQWTLVDATGMASPDTIAKIGVGRDAADVAFMTAYGTSEFIEQRVSVARV